MKTRRTQVNFPVLSDYEVRIIFTSDIEKSVLKYDHTAEIPVSDDTDALTIHVGGEGISYIFFQPNPSAGVVAHESWHVVHHMMNWTGVDIESEVIAYHLGYLVNHIFKFSRKKR